MQLLQFCSWCRFFCNKTGFPQKLEDARKTETLFFLEPSNFSSGTWFRPKKGRKRKKVRLSFFFPDWVLGRETIDWKILLRIFFPAIPVASVAAAAAATNSRFFVAVVNDDDDDNDDVDDDGDDKRDDDDDEEKKKSPVFCFFKFVAKKTWTPSDPGSRTTSGGREGGRMRKWERERERERERKEELSGESRSAGSRKKYFSPRSFAAATTRGKNLAPTLSLADAGFLWLRFEDVSHHHTARHTHASLHTHARTPTHTHNNPFA